MRSSWKLPDGPWVLHSLPLLGNLTERWVETQVESTVTFASRLMGIDVMPGASRQPHWLITRDRLDLWLANRGGFKSGGLSMIWLARAFRSSPPRILHEHYGTTASQHRRFAGALGCPLIVSFYGSDATKDRVTKTALWRKRYARLFREADAVLAEGPAMAGRIMGLGCPEDKVRVIRLPADARGLEPIVRREPDSFVVVAAGRAIEKKGFDIAVRAFAAAFRGKDARLVRIGGGPLQPMLEKLAREEGIAEQVAWINASAFPEFMSEIAGASVAIFPSREATNGDSDGGAPVTLIESQWLGVPVIVSAHDDLPYVSAPGGSIVLPPKDVDAWADALRGLYEDETRLRAMSKEAQQFARKHHSPETNALEREKVYESLVAQHQGSSHG